MCSDIDKAKAESIVVEPPPLTSPPLNLDPYTPTMNLDPYTPNMDLDPYAPATDWLGQNSNCMC